MLTLSSKTKFHDFQKIKEDDYSGCQVLKCSKCGKELVNQIGRDLTIKEVSNCKK